MKGFITKHAFPIKLLISAGLLGYCFYLLDWTTLHGLSVNWQWFLGAVILILIDHVIGALRFKILFDPVLRIGFARHIKYYFWAGFFNSTLPTSIGGDAMRIVWLCNHGVSANKSTFFVLLERLIGVATLLSIAGTMVIFLDVPRQLEDMLWATLQIVLIAAFLLLVVLRWTRKISYSRRGLRLLMTALSQLSLPAKSGLLVLSFLYQAVTIVITICLAVSIGIYLDWTIWFFIVPLLWLLTVLPISVGGLGVREVGLVFFLGIYAQSNEQAVALGLLTFVAYLIAGAFGGIWYSVDSDRIHNGPTFLRGDR